MTAVSPETNPLRRKRYIRQFAPKGLALTPVKRNLVQYVAEFRIASLPQLARLLELSPKATRRHARELFDAGLLEVIAVPRAALTAPEEGNATALLFGSAPNIYMVSATGQRLLFEHGLIEQVRSMPSYGPKNSLFISHELMVKDVRVWLECSTRSHPEQELTRWVEGEAAAMPVTTAKPIRSVRPDAWFTYRLGTRVLVGLLEADRGTERGNMRWSEKLAHYEALFAGTVLRQTTGFQHARVLVVTTSSARRDHLTELIRRLAPPPLQARFWLTTATVLSQPDLSHEAWIQPGSHLLKPLLPKAIRGETLDTQRLTHERR